MRLKSGGITLGTTALVALGALVLVQPVRADDGEDSPRFWAPAPPRLTAPSTTSLGSSTVSTAPLVPLAPVACAGSTAPCAVTLSSPKTLCASTFNNLQAAINCAKDGTSPTALSYVKVAGKCIGPVTVSGRKNLAILGSADVADLDSCGVPPAEFNTMPVVVGNGTDPVIRVTGGSTVLISQLDVAGGGDGVEYDVSTNLSTVYRSVSCSCLARNRKSGLEVEGGSVMSANQNRAQGNGDDGIHFNEVVDGLVIRNLATTNRDQGIEVIRGHTDTITKNTSILNGEEGIKLAAVDSFCVLNMSNNNGGHGIEIRHGARNLIDSNVSDGNAGAGISLEETNRATVINNEASANTAGNILISAVGKSVFNNNLIPTVTDTIVCTAGDSGNTGGNVPASCP